MAGLWRNDSRTPEGKYLVMRRDGSIPGWQWFVLGSRDPAAPYALRAYADAAEGLGMDPQYVQDMRELAHSFENDLVQLGKGQPDSGPDLTAEDADIVSKMPIGGSG